jgi:hypothetical protein
MKIYVDADACPVTRIAERVAKEHCIPVVLLCDTNHVLNSDYSEIRVIGAGADAVDIALINLCQRGDIVVTQDYGVAVLALGTDHVKGNVLCFQGIVQIFPVSAVLAETKGDGITDRHDIDLIGGGGVRRKLPCREQRRESQSPGCQKRSDPVHTEFLLF